MIFILKVFTKTLKCKYFVIFHKDNFQWEVNDIAQVFNCEKPLQDFNGKFGKLIEKIPKKEGWMLYFQHIEKNVFIPETNLYFSVMFIFYQEVIMHHTLSICRME